jgi:hypothetical protein
MDSNSSELPSGGTTTQRKGESLMTTKISQWQRIAMLAAGISTSLVSMAWGQNLYQTHSDGSIWVSTGTPCNTVSCPGWLELDNNPNMNMIAAGGGALYQLHNDGSIWWYIGPTCSGGYCPGWVELDNNPLAVAIGAGSNGILYEEHNDGSLWEWNGVICTGGFCPGWTELSSYNGGAGQPNIFGANAALYLQSTDQLGGTGLFRFTGVFNGWEEFTPGTLGAVGPNALYFFLDGGLFQYAGSTMVQIDNHPLSTGNLAAGGGMYQQRSNHSIWRYTGTPCNASASECPGWVMIDDHPYSGVPVAGSNTVYQMRTPPTGQVSIWRYTGKPCNGTVCSGWVPLDNNPNTTSIVAGPVIFYSLY